MGMLNIWCLTPIIAGKLVPGLFWSQAMLQQLSTAEDYPTSVYEGDAWSEFQTGRVCCHGEHSFFIRPVFMLIKGLGTELYLEQRI